MEVMAEGRQHQDEGPSSKPDGAGGAAADGKGGAGAENGGPADGPQPAEGGKQDPAAAVEALERRIPNLRKTGGVYVPPFKLARMMQDLQDTSSPEYQRLTWEALKKSINGIVNKINTSNIKSLLAEVFRENLVRGRGLFCRSLMKSQLASPSFSPVYSALVAVVNTKFPELGELLLHRLCLQFMRSYKRNDKPVCTAAARFLAHLINQGVAHEVLALEILILMLERPSGDSVEMACEFVKEVGAFLQDVAPQGLHSVFERFRAVLHEGNIEKRSQFVIEGLFAVRKAGFEASGYKAVPPELDLVDADDQITHEMSLDDVHDPQVGLDVFKVDPDYEQHEREYRAISKEILGDESDDEEGGEGGEEGTEEEDSEEAAENERRGQETQAIEDATQTNLVNLRRTIYLTIMSSLDFEEAGHKLMKIGVQPNQEIEMVTMVIECCAQERTYKRFYGLLAQRFCYISRSYMMHFDQCFRDQYAVIHRLETNKLRNVAALFAHLLATDALPWSCLNCVRLTEEETTSSSRIFIKYLFQELSSSMGVLKLAERINDPTCQEWFDGIFPKDTQANLRFAINFFTSIGLGGLTDKMREHYKEMPRIMAEKQAAQQAVIAKEAARQHALRPPSPSSSDSDDSSSTDSSDTESSDTDSSDTDSSDSSNSDSSDSESSSGSDSEEERRRRKKKGSSKEKEKAKAKEAKAKQKEKEKAKREKEKEKEKEREEKERRREKGKRAEKEEARAAEKERERRAEKEERRAAEKEREESRGGRDKEGRSSRREGGEGGEKRRERDSGYEDGERADAGRGGEEKRRRRESSRGRDEPSRSSRRDDREERGSRRR